MPNWFQLLYVPLRADSLDSIDWNNGGGYSIKHILSRRAARISRRGPEDPDITEFRKIWAVYEYLCNPRYIESIPKIKPGLVVKKLKFYFNFLF